MWFLQIHFQKWRSVDKGTLHNFSNIVCLIVAIICLVVPWAALSCIDHVVVPWSKCCGNVMWMSKNLKSGCCGSIAFLYRAPCRANKIYKKNYLISKYVATQLICEYFLLIFEGWSYYWFLGLDSCANRFQSKVCARQWLSTWLVNPLPPKCEWEYFSKLEREHFAKICFSFNAPIMVRYLIQRSKVNDIFLTKATRV